MSKTVRQVFLILGTLVLCFLIWQLVFNEGGILRTAYNAMAEGINEQFGRASGSDQLIPLWEESDATADANGQAFDIDIRA